ncbi:Calx-beta domain-containing protein [Dokdonella sp.]|uniref:Calx-beta domain-containing protein n=1 Tax=Dokdonella sp. TaxID=2291710 RepID=UPI003784515B
MTRTLATLLLFLLPLAAPAATCTWNTPSGNWSVASNWSGCADAAGPSTRAPGSGDTAVLANGTADLDISPTVAEFELGGNGVLSVVGSTKTFDVTSRLRFAGGRATTVLGSNQLLLYLHAGGSGSLLAPTTLENAVFFENSGTLTLGSAGGTALTLLVASEVRNMAGGTTAIAGGNSRLYLDGSSQLVNNAGAMLTISGNTVIGRATPASNYAIVKNLGTMVVNGPGTLDMPFGGSFSAFQQYGDLTVNNASIVCSQVATDKCSFRDANGMPAPAITRLNNAVLDLGGAAVSYSLGDVSTLAGTGTVQASIVLRGRIAPGALAGTPYGTLVVSGAVTVQETGILDVDLGGSAGGSHDLVQAGGAASAGFPTSFDGQGRLVLRLAGGYAPPLGAVVPVMTYASVTAGASFNRIDANYPLDYAARFAPTALEVFPAPRVTISDASVVEGATGMTPMGFNVHLSQPTTQAVTVEVRNRDGTAVYGTSPSGDYLLPSDYVFTFAPGEVLKTQVYPVNGDGVVEGNESFAVDLYRNKVTNAALGNGVPGSPTATGTIISDEIAPGTRFVLVGKDNGTSGRKIRRYTTGGTFIDDWDDRLPSGFGYIVTGICFAPNGNVLATRFAYPGPVLYSRFGAILDEDFTRHPLGNATFANHESCVFDHAGNVYIGQAGGSSSPDDQVPVLKFDRYGTRLDTLVLPTGPRGTDWIDLAGDDCTLYYTSEDTDVRRYNACTHTVLPMFATGLTPPYCYALRIRPNREVMVACQEAVHRLSPQGANLHTYTRTSIGETDASGLFAMNLDPDGTSFWTAGANSGNVYHVDIASGAVLGSFNSGQGGVAGLAVYDELHDDVIFQDGFDPPPALVPVVAKLGPHPQADCEREQQFWPEVREMPPFVPSWMALVAVREEDCEE